LTYFPKVSVGKDFRKISLLITAYQDVPQRIEKPREFCVSAYQTSTKSVKKRRKFARLFDGCRVYLNLTGMSRGDFQPNLILGLDKHLIEHYF